MFIFNSLLISFQEKAEGDDQAELVDEVAGDGSSVLTTTSTSKGAKS
jgi:hypothetical protein